MREEIALPEDKQKLFEAMFTAPVSTNELTETIFSEFEKIFEGEDSFVKGDFSTPEIEEDATEYRDKLQDAVLFRTEGMEQLRVGINSILIIDLPEEQTTPLPEPYFYWLDIENVIDIELTRVRAVRQQDGERTDNYKVEYIMFEEQEGIIAFFDEEHYFVFEQDDKGNYTLLRKEPHSFYKENGELISGLGQTPARFFWTNSLHSSNPYVKESPISKSLGELDYLLWYKTAQKCSDASSPFPIYSVMVGQCENRNEQGNVCVNGFIEYVHVQEGSEPIVEMRPCPACSGKKLVGAGTLVTYPAPDGEEQRIDLRNPVQVLYPEVDALDYIDKRIDTMEDDIFYSCTGWGGDSGQNNTQAKNRDQIHAGFESKITVLNRIKQNIEQAHHWALDGVYRLRYGTSYSGLTLNYGTKYYLKDEEAQREEYKVSKASGMPLYELQRQREELSHYQHRNNPLMLERDKIMMHLEPFPDLSIEQIVNLYNTAPMLVSTEELNLKLRLNELVKRFEREQMNIVGFGSLLEFSKKIEIIRETLLTYIQNESTRRKTAEPERFAGSETSGADSRRSGNNAGQPRR